MYGVDCIAMNRWIQFDFIDIWYLIYFVLAMHRLLEAISKSNQVATSHGQPCWRTWSTKVQVLEMWKGIQVQTSLEGNMNALFLHTFFRIIFHYYLQI